jgi:NADPH:quinone reductase-like Zn-dependent oxidoreductase
MGGPKLPDGVPLVKLLMKRSSILTTTLRDRSDDYKAELLKETYNYCKAQNILPLIDRTFNMTDVAAAHEYVESNQSIGKVVMINDL